MVNYCCVYGCGRNSKTHENLSFYSLPNDKHRQVAWLKAAGREDLVEQLLSRNDSGGFLRKSRRFCSRHFVPEDIKKDKSRHLASNVVPTLYLPGSWEKEQSDDEHTDIACNHCMKPVLGFRYKCVTCDDFDLCHNCNQLEVHREHFMLRIPKPMKFKLADNLIKKWRKFFKKAHVTPESLADNDLTGVSDESSDDDQPITKYAKNYDSGVDLSDDVKDQIRKEIQRVTSLKLDQQKKSKKSTKNQKKQDRSIIIESNSEREHIIVPKKRMKIERSLDVNFANHAPDVVFADVNDFKYQQTMDLKAETMDYPNMMPVISNVTGSAAPKTKPNLTRTPTETYSYPSITTFEATPVLPGPAYPEPPKVPGVHTYPEAPAKAPAVYPAVPPAVEGPDVDVQPVMHVKLSDDLSELMIEVAGSNQRTFYKYPESGNQGQGHV